MPSYSCETRNAAFSTGIVCLPTTGQLKVELVYAGVTNVARIMDQARRATQSSMEGANSARNAV